MTTVASAAPVAAPAAPTAPAHAAAAPGAPVSQAPAPEVAAPAAAAPAPAEAPVAPLALGEPSEPTEAEALAGEPGTPERGAVAYEPTGDVALDLTLNFLGKLGFDPSDVGMKAAADGDFGILKAQLAALGEKARGWEQFIAVGEKAYASKLASHNEKIKADREAIISVVGSEENWTKVQTWAQQNAEPAERDSVNAALQAGGIAAKAMASYLNGLYTKATGTVVEPAQVAPNGGNPVPGNGALSPEGYKAEVAALVSKIGAGRLDSSKEYKALQARRLAWRG